ncbi:GGDEF domain-containing protein [Luteimonas sp. SMYT11W]|uniref:diguanylate cyclase n=1 Tax=Luteimonas flava TaxID=3115822 RepID=A0ABU7WCI2_9GAMM
MRDARGWLLAAAMTVFGCTPAVAAAPDAAPGQPLTAQIERCFDLRESRPAEAIAIAHAALSGTDLPATDEIKLQTCLARASALTGDALTAIDAVDRVESLLAASPQSPEFALRALSNAGAALHLAGDVPRALALYTRAFEAAEAGDSDIAQIKMLNNVGNIHSEELEAFDDAVRIFTRAQAIADKGGLSEPILSYNQGLNHLRAGRKADARAAFAVALPQAEAIALGVVEQRSRAELAALDATGLEALPALMRIADAQRSDDPSGAAVTLMRMSRLALDAGEAAQALSHARDAVGIARAGAFRIEYRDAMRAEVAALRALGHYEAALDVQQTLRDVEVRALRSQNLGTLAGLQARLEDRHSASELARLHEQRRVDTLTQQHARRLRSAAIAGLAILVVLMLAFAWYQRRVNRRLYRLSSVDSLTRLLNRGAATHALRNMSSAAGGAARQVVFLLDVDYFKHSNDQHGHSTGDAILTEIAARLGTCCRPGDLVARWGGEEFLVACPALDLRGASDVAERLRAVVANTPFAFDGGQAALSVSIGFACWPTAAAAGLARKERWREAVDLADRALYASKRGGRDAWTGLWCDGDVVDVKAVLRDPEDAIATGDITAVSSRMPIQWRSSEPGSAAPGWQPRGTAADGGREPPAPR